MPAIKKEIAEYRDNARMTVVRQILMATTDSTHYSLSSKTADYPASKYNDKWFSVISRQALVQGAYPDYKTKLCAWPASISLARNAYGYSSPTFPITKGRVGTLRAILEAAGLDEMTATEQDLDALTGRLKWPGYPHRKKRQDTHFEWKELVSSQCLGARCSR